MEKWGGEQRKGAGEERIEMKRRSMERENQDRRGREGGMKGGGKGEIKTDWRTCKGVGERCLKK